MRGLTLCQPWASAIAIGLKRFETRFWATRYRGPLLIHAGRQIDWVIRRAAIIRLSAFDPEQAAYFDLHSSNLGKIVAIADLVECRSTTEPGCDADRWTNALPELESFFGDFGPSRFAWQLENVVRLAKPIPCRGAQGLWIPSCEVMDQLPCDALKRMDRSPKEAAHAGLVPPSQRTDHDW